MPNMVQPAYVGIAETLDFGSRPVRPRGSRGVSHRHYEDACDQIAAMCRRKRYIPVLDDAVASKEILTSIP